MYIKYSQYPVSGVTCHVSHVTCQMSHVKCCMPHVTCHMSLTPTAIATDPPPANSPTLHSRMVCKDKRFFLNARPFKLHSEPQFSILSPLCFHYFSVINHIVIVCRSKTLCKWSNNSPKQFVM